MLKPTPASIIGTFSQIFKDIPDPAQTIRERIWFRNILYFIDEQWLAWFNAQNTFGRRYEMTVTKPTPVSNIVRDYVRSLKALTLNKQYTTTIWPNSDEQADKDAAEMGVSVLNHMNARNNNEVEEIKDMVEQWRVITGNGFVRTIVVPDDGKYRFTKKGELLPPIGEVEVEVAIPFNMVVAPTGLTSREKEYMGQKSLRLKEWVEDIHRILIKEGESTAAVDYQKQLLTLVGNVSPWKGRGLEGAGLIDFLSKDLVVYQELEYKPNKEYPEGRYQIVCSGQVCCNATEMPIPVDREEGNWDYSWTHFAFDNTPGSFWATGPVDDLISPQNTINRIDQALEINRDTFGRPILFSPSEVVMKRITEKNQGILAVTYDGRAAMGARPVIQPGVPYPPQVLEERRIHVDVAQQSAGDPKNVLKGAAPAGASGVLVDILRETAEQSHAPDVKRFYRAWNDVDRKRLILAQLAYKESRLIKIKGKGNEILVKKFVGADLRSNFDVRLELDSGLSTTNVGRNYFIMELIKQNFWGPVFEKPQIQRELMKRMGMSGFPEESNLQRDRAELENSLMMEGTFENIAFPGIPDQTANDPQTGESVVLSWRMPPVIDPVFRIDDHASHMQVHDQMICSREFRTLPEQQQVFAVAHRLMHKEALLAEMAEQAAMIQGSPVQAGPPQPAAQKRPAIGTPTGQR